MKTFLPALTMEEEADLFAILKGADSQKAFEARQALSEHNLRLVAHVAKKYVGFGEDLEDLISIGTIGLIKAVSTFDASKGARLATYAARCVENEILMFFRAQRKGAQDVSLSDYIETGKNGTALCLMDVICSDDDLFEQLSDKEIYAKLYEKIDECLDERERRIILLRYGIGNRKALTQREIAAMCGISRSYVSRIEKKALQKLEKALSE